MISRIDHISIAVKDYKKALHFFKDILGAVQGAAAEDRNKKFYWQTLSLGDLSRLELITPAGTGSFLDRFLKKKKGGFHHITLQTPDIQAAKNTLDREGIPYFGYNEYAGVLWKEIFIHPDNAFGVLIQIAEFNPNDWIAPSEKMLDDAPFAITCSGDSVSIKFAHPGGGSALIQISRDKAEELMKGLKKILDL